MKKVEIEIPDGKKAIWKNDILTLIDIKPKDITDHIQTFDDAINELGKDHPSVISYDGYMNSTVGLVDNDLDIISYLKLRIICNALNEGWEPKFTKNERRYFPWFNLYTEENHSILSNKQRGIHRVLARSGFSAYAFGGVACIDCSFDSSFAFSYYGTRLAFKTRELAKYAGEQFIDIYADLNM